MRAFSMFTAVAVQPRIRLPYPGADTFDEGAVAANVAAGIRAIRTARATLDAGLVAFPEFFLTGYTYGVGVDGWLRASIRIPGPETDGLSEAAVREGVHVAGAAYEVIDGFPGRFFNTAFLIAPNGDVRRDPFQPQRLGRAAPGRRYVREARPGLRKSLLSDLAEYRTLRERRRRGRGRKRTVGDHRLPGAHPVEQGSL